MWTKRAAGTDKRNFIFYFFFLQKIDPKAYLLQIIFFSQHIPRSELKTVKTLSPNGDIENGLSAFFKIDEFEESELPSHQCTKGRI